MTARPKAQAGPKSPGLIMCLRRPRRRSANCTCAGASAAKVEWSEVVLAETAPPPARTVRLATALHFPRGGTTPTDNCGQFDPLIADAARQRADLWGCPRRSPPAGRLVYAEGAEPVPGPSTETSARSRRHDLYLVAGLIERDWHLVFNTGGAYRARRRHRR